MPDTIRAFIAFELPRTILSSMKEIQDRLKNFGFRIKWVPSENIHLTLKFLGNINTSQVEKIASAMARSTSGAGPMDLVVKGIGVFPDIKRPRVLWAGIAGRLDLLHGLKKRLEEELFREDFPKETRAFQSHLTLGRFKGRTSMETLQHAMDTFKDFRSDVFTVRELYLIKSELKPTGAVYTPLLKIPMRV
ncbi:MAG: RNA 2',3'-cyclic phosphodiesterase [Deltaproteobacteria bacterium]|nr:RNA 2',3'-cyclic phosphodiesterase [Deltaproteobacteria bacterium]